MEAFTLLRRVRQLFPLIRRILMTADTRERKWYAQFVRHSDAAGFEVLIRRYVLEPAFAWKALSASNDDRLRMMSLINQIDVGIAKKCETIRLD